MWIVLMMIALALATEADAAGPQVGVPWAGARELARPKPINPDTMLLRDGQPAAAIVAPEGAEWQELAAKLKTATGLPIARAGGVVSGPVDAWTPQALQPLGQGGRHLILLGDLNTNPAIARLYYQWQAFEDGAFPGAGGYTIRTVVDPEGLGWNAIILGGQSPAEAGLAAEAFTEKLQRDGASVMAPHTLEVRWGEGGQPTADMKGRAEGVIVQIPAWEKFLLDINHPDYKAIRPANSVFEWASDVLTVPFTFGALHYAMYGDPALAKMAGHAIDALYEKMDWIEANRAESWDAHYNYEFWLRSWQQVANCPVLTDEQRARGAAIFGFLAGQTCMYQWPLGDYGKTTYRTLTRHEYSGIFAGDALCRYVQKHSEVQAPLSDLLAANRANFGVVIETMLGDYMTGFDHKWGLDGNWHLFQAAVEEPRPEFITSGLARLSADYATMVVNNAGKFVNYGSENVSPLENYDAWQVLGRAEALFKDGSYKWWMDRHLGTPYKIFIMGMNYFGHWYQPGRGAQPVRAASSREASRLEAARTGPEAAFIGLNRLPLARHVYEDLKAGRGRIYEGIPVVNDVPFDEGFSKITMREGLTPDDQYLLLDGLGGITYSGADAGAISEYSRYGQRLLVQIEDKPDPFYQNFVSVSRGNALEPTGAFARMTQMVDLGPMMYVRLEVEPLCGARAERHLFMEKGKLCLAFDEVTLKDQDEYVLTSNWRALGEPSQEGYGQWRFANEQADLQLQSVPLPGIARPTFSISDRSSGISQETMAFKIRLLRETISRQFQAGESYRWANLFQGVKPGETGPQASALSQTAVALGDGTIYAAARNGVINFGKLRLQASACRIGSQDAQLVSAAQVVANGKTLLKLAEPVTFSLELAKKQALVQSPQSQQVGTINRSPVWTAAHSWAEVTKGITLPSKAKLKLDVNALWAALHAEVQPAPPPAPSVSALPAAAMSVDTKTLLQTEAAINETCLWDYGIVAVTADGHILTSDLQGNPGLDVPLGEPLMSCWAGKLKGQDVILAGGLQGLLVALDPAGNKLWEARNTRYWYGPSPAIYSIAVGDFAGDGGQMIACGTHGGGSLFDATGNFVNFKQTYSHAMEPLQAVTLYGGEQWALGTTWGHGLKLWQPVKQEMVDPWFASWGRVAHDVTMVSVGDDLWFAYAGPHGIACARLDREAWLAGKRDASVWLGSWYLRSDGETTALLPVDLNADGTPEILTANETGFLVWYNLQGERFGKKLVGMPVGDIILRNVTGDDQPEIVLSGNGPQVLALDRDMKVIGQWSDQTGQPVTRMMDAPQGIVLQSEKMVRLLAP